MKICPHFLAELGNILSNIKLPFSCMYLQSVSDLYKDRKFYQQFSEGLTS